MNQVNYMICIDEDCKNQRLVSKWEDSFLHKQCRPLLQFSQFITQLNMAIKENKEIFLENLESQIYQKFEDFKNLLIKRVSQFVGTLETQIFPHQNSYFTDSLAETYDAINVYNPVDLRNIELDILDPVFIENCLPVLENQADFPIEFYPKEDFFHLEQSFARLKNAIDEIFYSPIDLSNSGSFVPFCENEEFDLFNQNLPDFLPFHSQEQQEPEISIPQPSVPLKGYKLLENQQFQDTQFAQQYISPDHTNVLPDPLILPIISRENIFREPQTLNQSYSHPLKNYKEFQENQSNKVRDLENKSKIATNTLTQQFIESLAKNEIVDYTTLSKSKNQENIKYEQATVNKKNAKEKNEKQQTQYEEQDRNFEYDNQNKQKERKQQNFQRNLPNFQIVKQISVFDSKYTQGNIALSRTKLSAVSSSNGTVYFQGFLNKENQYKLRLELIKKTTNKNQDYFAEIGLIDWDNFQYPKLFNQEQQGVYSLTSLGNICQNCSFKRSKAYLTHKSLISMQFDGKQNQLIFKINNDQVILSVGNRIKSNYQASKGKQFYLHLYHILNSSQNADWTLKYLKIIIYHLLLDHTIQYTINCFNLFSLPKTMIFTMKSQMSLQFIIIENESIIVVVKKF